MCCGSILQAVVVGHKNRTLALPRFDLVFIYSAYRHMSTTTTTTTTTTAKQQQQQHHQNQNHHHHQQQPELDLYPPYDDGRNKFGAAKMI